MPSPALPINVYAKAFQSALSPSDKRNVGEGLGWGKRGDYWDSWERQKALRSIYWGNDILYGKRAQGVEKRPVSEDVESEGNQKAPPERGLETSGDQKEIVVSDLNNVKRVFPPWWTQIVKSRFGKRGGTKEKKRVIMNKAEDLDLSLHKIRVGCSKLLMIGEVLCQRIKGVNPDTPCSVGNGFLPIPEICGDTSNHDMVALKKDRFWSRNNQAGGAANPSTAKFHKIFVRI